MVPKIAKKSKKPNFKVLIMARKNDYSYMVTRKQGGTRTDAKSLLDLGPIRTPGSIFKMDGNFWTHGYDYITWVPNEILVTQ